MLLADTLSRAYWKDGHKSQRDLEVEVVTMVGFVPISAERLSEIRTATRTDKKLQTLITTIQKGWEQDKKQVPDDVMHYFSFQDELSTQDGLVFRGERVVIPESRQAEINQQIHSSHLEIEGCLRRARECIYWPGMNERIKTYVTKVWHMQGGRQ